MPSRLLAPIVALALAASPAAAQQPTRDANAWQALAQTLEPGALISVRTRDGARIRATFVQPSPEGILVKPKTRLTVPMREIAFTDIDAIERQKGGMSPGLKVLIGVGIGLGVLALIGGIAAASSY